MGTRLLFASMALIALVGQVCGQAARTQPAATRPTDEAVRVKAQIIKVLARQMKAKYWVARTFGVIMMARVDDPAATDALLAVVKDRDLRVRKAALVALVARRALLSDEQRTTVAALVRRNGLRGLTERIGPAQDDLAALKKMADGPKFEAAWKVQFAGVLSDDLLAGLAAIGRQRKSRDLVEWLIQRTLRFTSYRKADYTLRRFVVDYPDPITPRQWQDIWRIWKQPGVLDDLLAGPLPVAEDGGLARPMSVLDALTPRPIGPRNSPETLRLLEVFLDGLKDRDLDIVIVFDSTGSMGPLIGELKKNLDVILELLRGVLHEPLVGLTTYRDKGDAYVTRLLRLSDRWSKHKRFLARVKAAGGGDTPEAVSKALHETLRQNKFRKRASKVIVLIGDAPPHAEHMRDIEELIKAAAKRGYVFNTIALGKRAVRVPMPPRMRRLRLPRPLDLHEAFEKIARWGNGTASVSDVQAAVTEILVLAFGTEWRAEIRTFVALYVQYLH